MSIADPALVLTRAASAAIGRGVPAAVAGKASRVALARASAAAEPWAAARIEAYYWGVLRRLILRGGEATAAARQRLLAASIDPVAARGESRQERLPLAS